MSVAMTLCHRRRQGDVRLLTADSDISHQVMRRWLPSSSPDGSEQPGPPLVGPPVCLADYYRNRRHRDGAHQERIQQNPHADYEAHLDHSADAGEHQAKHRGGKDDTGRSDHTAGRADGADYAQTHAIPRLVTNPGDEKQIV